MRIGYFESLDTLPSSYSTRRSIKLAKEALEGQGFVLVPFILTSEEVGIFKNIALTLLVSYTVGPLSAKIQ